jgi:NADH-quinone oxidoreductase subunit A
MEWGSVALYFAVVVALGGGIVAASRLLGPRRPAPEKLDAYECGVPVITSPLQRLSVHFYLVAILFILFDIETVFLIPWAVLFRKLGVTGLLEMGVFLGVVGFGLVYIWRRGALEWD